MVSKLRRPGAPLLALAGAFVAAGGVVHLREWLDTYRHIPASLPGADVVRIGFLINVAVSAILVLALLAAVFAGRRVATVVIGTAALFEAASLATLIQTRRAAVLGWMEGGWSRGATQTRAVEIGALILLAAAAGTVIMVRRTSEETLDGRVHPSSVDVSAP